MCVLSTFGSTVPDISKRKRESERMSLLIFLVSVGLSDQHYN